jgi:hypothetical protein
VTQNVQGCLLPHYSLCSSPRALGASRPFPFCYETGFCLAHVTPIKADEKKEKTMTAIDFALLIGALAHLFAALAHLATAIWHRRMP